MSERPINSTRELREELDAVVNRARDASFIRDKRDEPATRCRTKMNRGRPPTSSEK